MSERKGPNGCSDLKCTIPGVISTLRRTDGLWRLSLSWMRSQSSDGGGGAKITGKLGKKKRGGGGDQIVLIVFFGNLACGDLQNFS